MRWDDVAEDGIDNTPGGLHCILACEREVHALQRRTDEPVVRSHVRAGVYGEGQLLDLRLPTRARLLADEAQPDLRLGPNAEPKPNSGIGTAELRNRERRRAEP